MERGKEKLTSNVQLPEEIIVEILSRLPVKALLLCKCICKLWKCLISNTDFVLSPTGRDRAVVGFLPFSKGRSVDSRHMHFYSIDDKFSVEKLPDPVGEVPSSYSFFTLFGTCNGLVLFSTNQGMYLWNPLTSCCRLLTQLKGLNDKYVRPLQISASGLCFDKSSNDYKAVLVIEDWPASSSSQSVYVASLRTGELLWMDNNFPYSVSIIDLLYIPSTSGVLVSNHLHWIMERETDKLPLIVCFDEKMNQFTELLMPEDHVSGDAFSSYMFGLTVLYGCLCMSKGKGLSIDDMMDVLIMREYGVKHSWTKLFTIRGLLVPLQTRVPNNTILVLKRNGLLYTYNIEKKCFKRIKCPPSGLRQKIRDNLRSEAGTEIPLVMNRMAGPSMFVESLTSVNSI